MHGLYDTMITPAEQALAHPINTAIELGKRAIGKDDLDAISTAVKSGDYKGAALHLGKWALGRTPEGMSIQTGYDVAKPTIDALKQGDIPTAVGRGLGTVLPFAGGPAVGKAAQGVDALADSTAAGLTKSALKGGYTVATPAEDVASAVQTARDNKIPITPAGQSKITDALTQIRQSITKKTTDAAAAGVKVDPNSVMTRLDQLRSKYEQQVDPVQDLKDIDRTGKNFMAQNTSTVPGKPAQPPSSILGPNGQPITPATPATPPSSVTVPIPADQAQAVKVGSNALNADKYGKISTAQMEAEKALTRGIKEELESQIPELGSLNANQAKLMNLEDILGKAVNKYTNSAGFAGDLGHTGVAASALRTVIANPMVKARIATMIDLARHANPGKFAASAANGTAAVNSLIASLTPENDPQQQPQK